VERELPATGEQARKRVVNPREDLTAQEAQIAVQARDGVSNAEIAARLFISRRTVEYHLSKVFTKLGISSRYELARVLPPEPTAVFAAWQSHKTCLDSAPAPRRCLDVTHAGPAGGSARRVVG
jgi:DNA-binding CsgD family transcriptional regulator